MSETLRECPFCGSVMETKYYANMGYIVYCTNEADCPGNMEFWETEREAITAWNTRPIEDELLEKFQQLQAKVAYLESALVDTENDKDRALSAFNELDSKWDAIPWEAIEIGRAVLAWGFRQVRHEELAALTKFIDANAPEETGE